MIIEYLLAIGKDEIPAVAKALRRNDLPQLVDWLSLSDDKIRYPSLLLLINRSRISEDVYRFWDVFKAKLLSDNSYQRSIGLILIANNVKWDKDNRIDDTIDDYLALLDDEKPITVRQCIQSLAEIVPYKPHLNEKIAGRLMAMDIQSKRQTMQKLIMIDALNVLAIIKKNGSNEEIDKYFMDALSGGLLDKKAKRQIQQAI